MGAALRHHAPKVRLCGIDANTAMLARNRKRQIGYAELVEGTVERLPFPDDSFDAVMIGFAFHDFPSPDQACRELHRVLRPGGRLVDLELTVPTARPLRAGYLAWLKVFGSFRGHGDCPDTATCGTRSATVLMTHTFWSG
jgi:ubiquinone/menaquinone biosynthesis C-methylase UbiE